MLQIAKENAVAEKALLLLSDCKNGTDTPIPKIPLQWWTPQIEIDLCGHATLAAAHYLVNHSSIFGPKCNTEVDVMPRPTVKHRHQPIVFAMASGNVMVHVKEVEIESKKSKYQQPPPTLQSTPTLVYQLDFLARMPVADDTVTESIMQSLSHPPKEVFKA